MKGLALGACIFVVHTAIASAQSTEAESAPDPKAAESGSAASIDGAKLGVSFDRIRIQLAAKPETKTPIGGLKIQETIQVIGTAPKIQLWDPETAKLATGPVPWGAPTHKDFIDLVTPQEFKTYPMDINALLQWLMQRLAEKTEKKSTE
jgi:hypothetical protein